MGRGGPKLSGNILHFRQQSAQRQHGLGPDKVSKTESSTYAPVQHSIGHNTSNIDGSVVTFSNCPDGWNRAPVIPLSQRLSLASASSFLGTNYHAKFQPPGPGSYSGTAKSTIICEHTSLTRHSDFPRRSRNCKAMQGPEATASLCGADQLLQEPGPDPGTYESPASIFREACSKKAYCTSQFASQSSRFPNERHAHATDHGFNGKPEGRTYARALPKLKRAQVSTLAPTDRRPMTVGFRIEPFASSTIGSVNSCR